MSERAEIQLIGTDFPPEVCGIGDFSYLLAQHVTAMGLPVAIKQEKFRTFGAGLECIRAVYRQGCRLIHFHYPNTSWKGSLVPFLLPLFFLGKRSVVTVHEYRRSSSIGRWLSVTWSLFCARIVFTNREDMKMYLDKFPWARAKTVRIAISSNIAAREPDYAAQKKLILYFGMVYPGKGLEAFLELARLLEAQGAGYGFRIVGGILAGYTDYVAGLKAGAPPGVTWAADLSAEDVSAELASARFVYLPFEAGASERNGSLLAALAHGTPVISTPGEDPYPGFAEAMFLVRTPQEAAEIVKACDADEAMRREKGMRGLQFFQANFSWDSVAGDYVKLFREFLKR